MSLFIDCRGTAKIDEQALLKKIPELVDLTPRGIIDRLQLCRPIYTPTAAYGHFGRKPGTNGEFSWEKTDLIKELTACFLDDKPHFFGRRKGRRIRKAKTALLEDFLPRVALDPQKPLAFGIIPEKICLEIGFGDGVHLAGIAALHPENGYIGAEVFQNGVANLLSLVTGIKEGSEITENISLLPERRDNIRVYGDDIRLLFPLLPDASIDGIFLLFPDPWPKKRHAGRRFVNPDNLKQLARILKPGGKLLIATDHPVYKRWTLRQMHENKNFRWTAVCGSDWKHEPADWVKTKYQQKALREGRRPVFLEYERV